ncbi:MAG: YegS/Rv2252/BmrU family lipid kinase [Peptostreptococcaceae bacterium]|nr:YegS/Rv2252/BmrU family lipid kinase [Peptostreptococcaceae bacterium]
MSINPDRKKVLLFYNPNAGNGLFKTNLDVIIERFQAKNLMVIPVRASKADALEAVLSTIDQKEYRQIIAAGGDGTINICINAMMQNNINLPLAIFPAGTANDFAYCLDLPLEIDRMIDIALGTSFTYSDVGKVNSKYFLNVAAMGMLVDVSQKTDPDMKNTLGVISYYIRGIADVPNLKPIPIKIVSEEFSGEVRMYFMLVMNGRSAGGFKRITPNAEINDGLFDVILFREMPIIDFVPLLIDVLQGSHKQNKNILYFKTNKLYIESPNSVGTDIDGEKGEGFPLSFDLLPKRIKIYTLTNDQKGSNW